MTSIPFPKKPPMNIKESNEEIHTISQTIIISSKKINQESSLVELLIWIKESTQKLNQ
jgi:hypothetical protein